MNAESLTQSGLPDSGDKHGARSAPYELRRVHRDGCEEFASEHQCFEEGWAAGQEAVHADREAAFSLYRNGRRVARFCHHRVAVRSKSFDWSVLS